MLASFEKCLLLRTNFKDLQFDLMYMCGKKRLRGADSCTDLVFSATLNSKPRERQKRTRNYLRQRLDAAIKTHSLEPQCDLCHKKFKGHVFWPNAHSYTRR